MFGQPFGLVQPLRPSLKLAADPQRRADNPVRRPFRISVFQASCLLAAAALFCSGCGQQQAPEADRGPVSPIPSPDESATTTDTSPLPTPELNPPLESAPARKTETPAAKPAAAGKTQPPPKAASAAKKPEPKPPAKASPQASGKPPGPSYEPVVIMSEAHANTCLLKVGDSIPEMPLVDLEGRPQTLSQFYGPKLTLLVFWNARKAYASEQFARLEREVHQPYGGRGLNVVAVNVGDSPEQVRELSQQGAAAFPCFLDAKGAALALVATGKLPRSYLLDPQGKVLWLEIEYSQGARRELRNAIDYYSRNVE